MGVEENKAFVLAWIERAFNGADLSAIDEVIAPGYRGHNPMNPAPDQEPGPEGVKRAFTALRDAFPDMHQTVEDVVAEGDEVVVRGRFRGTHQGPFAGLPPRGRAFDVAAMEIFRLDGEQIAEHWIVMDTYTMMRQLGAVQEPAGTIA